MTYDILKKASKTEIISWLQEHKVQLPDISDEQFINEVSLLRLKQQEATLLYADADLTARMESVRDQNPIEYMGLMISSDKINKNLQKVREKLTLLEGHQPE